MRKILVLCSFICVFGYSNAWATQQKPKKEMNGASGEVFASVADEINHDIGEMLGAWQVGDIEAMHSYYAEDATWVSGGFNAPIAGWQNYLPEYLQSRKGFRGIQLVTRNVNVFHYGDTAWACYQWEFMGLNEGKAVSARGQTTLVFVKQGGRWLIVHNHTSQICPGS